MDRKIVYTEDKEHKNININIQPFGISFFTTTSKDIKNKK